MVYMHGEDKTMIANFKRLYVERIPRMSILLGIFIFSGITGLKAQEAQTLDFGKIWEKIRENSHTQKALSLESRAAKISSNKASKHPLLRKLAIIWFGVSANSNLPQ